MKDLNRASDAAPAEKTSPAKILITEDEFIVALDLQSRLQHLGYEVVGIASSGDDAILQVQDKHPDLVLMDIMLYGDMDGIEASKYIREHCDVPVIFLTANSDPATLERAGATHPFSCLLKPFKERELKFSVDMALYHHRTSRQLRAAHDELEQRVQERTAELAATNSALQTELQLHQNTLKMLRAAQAIAHDADLTKNEFLATISHELLTPMNGVLGMTELLREAAPTPLQRQYIDAVQLSGETLLTLINDMLDFSRIETGTMESPHTPFSLSHQLNSFLQPLRLRARAKSLQLSWTIAEDIPDLLVADPVHIGQVLINLVGNSIKFTESGRVDVTVKSLHLEQDRVELAFAVRDTGIGIPEDKQTAIFEPFVQADNSFSRRYGGAGLGLSIAKRLVKLMGGSLSIESKLGAGSLFQFNLWADVAADKNIDSGDLLTSSSL
jgi:signal transduction histidine kinase